MLDRVLQGDEKFRRRLRRNRADDAASHEEAESVNGVARIGHEDDVARRGDRLRHVGEAFLRAQRGDDLRIRIELHTEAALVIGRLGAPQAGNAAGRRITVGSRLADGFLQLLDDMRGRRQVRIAHAEIDDICPGIACDRLRLVDDFENVRGETADAVKIFHKPFAPRHRRIFAG
jgi:hypothetical protein